MISRRFTTDERSEGDISPGEHSHTFQGNLTFVTRGFHSYIDILKEKQQLSPYSATTNMGLCMRARWRLRMVPGIFNIEEVIATRTDQLRLIVSEGHDMSLYRSNSVGHVLSNSKSMHFVLAVRQTFSVLASKS